MLPPFIFKGFQCVQHNRNVIYIRIYIYRKNVNPVKNTRKYKKETYDVLRPCRLSPWYLKMPRLPNLPRERTN